MLKCFIEDIYESCVSLNEDNVGSMFETCGFDVYESVVDGSVLVKELAEEEIMLVALV